MPELCVDEMLPWMLESPLFPNIALFSSAIALSLMKDTPLTDNREVIILKSSVLSQVNQFLSQKELRSVAQEVLRSVIHLAMIEVSQYDGRTRSQQSLI